MMREKLREKKKNKQIPNWKIDTCFKNCIRIQVKIIIDCWLTPEALLFEA